MEEHHDRTQSAMYGDRGNVWRQTTGPFTAIICLRLDSGKGREG